MDPENRPVKEPINSSESAEMNGDQPSALNTTGETTSDISRRPANDRVTLGENEKRIVESWLVQISEWSKGYFALSKSDIVNFLVREHQTELSHRELSRIKADHYDPIRHINWITPQIRLAIQSSDMARVLELQEELRKINLSADKDNLRKARAVTAPKKLSQRKRKTNPDSMQKEKETAASSE